MDETVEADSTLLGLLEDPIAAIQHYKLDQLEIKEGMQD